MTITLQPEQEQAIQEAIRTGTFRSIDEFIDAAIATLPTAPAIEPSTPSYVPLVETAGRVELRRYFDQGTH